jgi:hypothetical protein
MPPPYAVVIDGGSTAVTNMNSELYDNGTHRWIYFAYRHSTHEGFIIRAPDLAGIAIFMISGAIALARGLRLILYG